MQTMKHRLSLVGVIAGLVAIVALAYVALPAIVAEAAHPIAPLTLHIQVRGETFDLHDHRPRHQDGPFYVEGDIFDAPGGSIIGEFNCWGWIRSDGPPFVSQEYILDGLGAIQTQGNEGSDSIAIVGGTGIFSDARGEATYTPSTIAGFARVFDF